MAANIKVLRYISYRRSPGKAITKAKDHVKYMEVNREYHRNTPQLFTEGKERVDRREFFQALERQPRGGVVLHKMVITISEEERNRLRIDLKELTRDTMSAIQARMNCRMDWVAAVHDDPGHPHCHIAIRGRDLAGRQIYIGKKHIQEFRKIVDEQKRLQAERNLGPEKAREIMKELDRKAEEIKSRTKDLGDRQPHRTGFGEGLSRNLLNFFQQLARQGEREQELARQRAARVARYRAEKERRQREGRGR